MGFGDCPHCGSNKEKPFSIPFPYEGRLLFTNTQAAYGGWPSERMHTKAWSSRQPTLHVPGGPRLEEVRLREERAEVVERAQKTSRGQGSHTHWLLFSILQEVKSACVCGCVCLWVCVKMKREEWDASPQTILFSSKAILFDILSSRILLRATTMKTTNKRENRLNNIKPSPPSITFSHHFK